MNSLVRQILPISSEEFAKLFRRCRPPSGWSETIAVSNSGGPDSTCLLFLIKRFLSENTHVQDLPRRAVSIHVDHGLQASAASMAEQCAQSAKSIGVEHFTYKIPWSKGSWPDKPDQHAAMEHDARKARYRILFEAMSDLDAKIIALGHHMDDQVETLLMRVMKGSTSDGAAGMKYIRRWGMGFGVHETTDKNWPWVAHEGMRRWMVRPLLGLPKDRIYATCEENNISYVVDPTNFDDSLTIRNSFRKWLTDPSQLDSVKLSKEAQETLDEYGIELSGGRDRVYPILQDLATEAENIEQEVDSLVSRSTLGSPVGTYLMSCASLSSITDFKIKRAFILRILRYVSFWPWGSLAAQVHRRRHSLGQITDKLWCTNPFRSKISPFCAGGGVVWSPVVFKGSSFRIPEPAYYHEHQNSPAGWLVSRQVPLTRSSGSSGWNPLSLFVTHFLRQRFAQNATTAEVLWDSRFLVTFDLTKIPSDVLEVVKDPYAGAEIQIKSRSRWFWPLVVLRQDGKDTELHFKVDIEENSLISELHKDRDMSWRKVEREVESSWITTKYIRELSSL